jgi:filamentous hemagglutinin
VSVAANQVLVADGANLTANQIYIVAHQSIEVASGAMLASTSGTAGTPLATLPAMQPLILSDPSAAFLAVSDLELPLVARTGAASGGSVTLDPGSNLKSGGALVLDAPSNVSIADGTVSAAGASWSLGSNSIAFVGISGQQPDTLNIDASLTQALQSAGAVRLASQGNLDLYVPVTLGAVSVGTAPTLDALTLLATTIDNQNGGSSVFGAQKSHPGQPHAAGGWAPAAGAGTLALVANTLNLASSGTNVSGFATPSCKCMASSSSAASQHLGPRRRR